MVPWSLRTHCLPQVEAALEQPVIAYVATCSLWAGIIWTLSSCYCNTYRYGQKAWILGESVIGLPRACKGTTGVDAAAVALLLQAEL